MVSIIANPLRSRCYWAQFILTSPKNAWNFKRAIFFIRPKYSSTRNLSLPLFCSLCLLLKRTPTYKTHYFSSLLRDKKHYLEEQKNCWDFFEMLFLFYCCERWWCPFLFRVSSIVLLQHYYIFCYTGISTNDLLAWKKNNSHVSWPLLGS